VHDEIWRDVHPAWRHTFELSWESFVAGSPPVGAVVVAPDGSVVARGRSRRGETTAPRNQLAGSRLAHAEVNALAQLRPDQHEGYELYVTLEPCVLCAAAIATALVQRVSFAGEDPLWRFVGGMRELHPVLRDRWYVSSGPLDGVLGAWAALLPLVDRLARDPAGDRVEAYRAALPELVALAGRLVADGVDVELRKLSLDDAMRAVQPLPS
jgi:tRNA(adenine34) deaminase